MIRFVAIVILFTLGSSVVEAAPSLQEIIGRFEEVSPVIAAAKARDREAQYLYKEARARFYPEISLVAQAKDRKITAASFGLDASSSSAFSFPNEYYYAGVQVNQPLYMGGRIINSYRLREKQKTWAKLNLENEKRRSLSRLLENLIELDYVNRSIQVLKQSQKNQKEFVDITKIKKRRGLARNFEVDQAAAEYISYLPRIDAVELAQKNLVSQLGTQLNWPSSELSEFYFPMPSEHFVDIQGKVSEWVVRAKARRPDLQSQQLQVEQAEIQKEIDMGSHYPNLALSATWSSQATSTSDMFGSDADSRDIAINLSVPLFSGLSSVQTKRAAQERVFVAEKALQGGLQQLEVSVTGSHAAVMSAMDRVEMAAKWARVAERALLGGLKNYRVGVVNSVQVVQLQLGNERAALNQIEAWKNYHQSVLQWHLAVGDQIEQVYK